MTLRSHLNLKYVNSDWENVNWFDDDLMLECMASFPQQTLFFLQVPAHVVYIMTTSDTKSDGLWTELCCHCHDIHLSMPQRVAFGPISQRQKNGLTVRLRFDLFPGSALDR